MYKLFIYFYRHNAKLLTAKTRLQVFDNLASFRMYRKFKLRLLSYLSYSEVVLLACKQQQEHLELE